MKKIKFLEELLLAGGIQAHDDGGDGGEGGTGGDGGGAGGDGGAGDSGGAGEGDKGGQGDGGGEKTFSQEDVNNMVAKSSKSTTEKLLKDLGIEDFKGAKDGMKKFKEWQDSQKTESQKLTDDLEALKTSSSEDKKALAGYKARDIAFEKGVKDPKNQAKLVKLASVSDIEDMGEAMDALLLEYPMFKGEEAPGQFGAGTKGKGGGQQSSEAKDAVRKAMGLK